MKILGVDYGRAKIGLAVSDGPLAEPYSVIRVSDSEQALDKIEKIVKVEKVDKVVVGVSEGEMAQEQEEFARKLHEKLKIPVETQDETLSTQDAQHFAIEGGKGRLKRRQMEDAYAASVILQSYLDCSSER